MGLPSLGHTMMLLELGDPDVPEALPRALVDGEQDHADGIAHARDMLDD